MTNAEIAIFDEKRLAFSRIGEWNTEVVLFFHGFLGSRNYFPDYEYDDKCILSFDRPGIGDSSLTGPYAMEDFLTQVRAVLADHGVTAVRLIGHSAGGYYAQVFAAMFPELVRSLSLVSSVIPLNMPGTLRFGGAKWRTVAFLLQHCKRFSRFFIRRMATSVRQDYDAQLAGNLKTLPDKERAYIESHPEQIKRAILEAVTHDGEGAFLDASALSRRRKELRVSADIPVYLWHGTADQTVSIAVLEFFEKSYSVQASHRIPGAGHMLYLPSWPDILAEATK